MHGLGWNADVRIGRGDLERPRYGHGLLPRASLRLLDAVGPPTTAAPTRHDAVDQGPTNSCVGQAIVRAVHVHLLSQGLAPHWGSVLGVYLMARIWGQPLTPPLDQGCYPRDAIDAVSSWGLMPETAWPFVPSNINTPVDLDLVERAALYKVANWRRSTLGGRDRVTEIMTLLHAGYPWVFGLNTDEAFFEPVPGRIYERDATARSVGGHMMALLGYETCQDGSIAFHYCNTHEGHARGLIGGDTIGGPWVDDCYALQAAPLF